MPAPFNGKAGSRGPRGLLGIPPRKFRERTLPTQTAARVVQIGLEVWAVGNPEVQFTQVGLEVWTRSDDQLRRLVNVYFV